jgi:N6-L-threonylcarbamoyladenine synthase
VHHIRAHVAACYLTDPDWEPPFLALVASGGHTLVLDVKGYTEYAVVASTRDDAAGEAFDKVARVLGLGYPGGAAIDRLAGNGDPTAFDLPRGVLSDGDLSFSGLKTAVLQIVNRAKMRGETTNIDDLAASFTASVCETLVTRTSEALKFTGHRKLCMTGGVAANAHLRRAIAKMAEKNDVVYCFPKVQLCADNAEMVGAQAFFEWQAGNITDSRLNAMASWDVEKALCQPVPTLANQ